MTYTQDELREIVKKHWQWLNDEEGGCRADLYGADLRRANLRGANLRDADLRRANLRGADLRDADLRGADLCDADLRDADLRGANLRDANLYGADLRDADLRDANLRDANLYGANLCDADLRGADLRGANLYGANLYGADLCDADLRGADLRGADLRGADLRGADLRGAKNLIKMIGVEIGNYYWKRADANMMCNDYQFKLGLNKLRDGEVFAADERVLCSYPGFHFASRSWCALNYGDRPLELKIRIPEGAQINEPWATDGKASADMIEVVEIWRDGVNVTEEYRDAT